MFESESQHTWSGSCDVFLGFWFVGFDVWVDVCFFWVVATATLDDGCHHPFASASLTAGPFSLFLFLFRGGAYVGEQGP